MIEGKQLTELLGLHKQSVAIAFRDSASDAIRRIEPPSPSGWSSWKCAAEGRTFYYFVIAGSRIKGLLEKLATIVRANRELQKYHCLRVGSREDA